MLRFAEWQENRGIKPWVFQPNHIEGTFDSLETFFKQATKAFIKMGDVMKEVSISFYAFTEKLNKEK